ncbi:UNVERIFIED_CONTAM: hypothetical protein K2H54_019487 [Gekko kuhli]
MCDAGPSWPLPSCRPKMADQHFGSVLFSCYFLKKASPRQRPSQREAAVVSELQGKADWPLVCRKSLAACEARMDWGGLSVCGTWGGEPMQDYLPEHEAVHCQGHACMHITTRCSASGFTHLF